MSGLDGAQLPDETSGPQRVFEGDLVVPLMSPWLAFADLLRLAQTNRACMREISIGVREIGLTEFEDPATGRITDAVIASISRRFPSLRVLYLHQCVDITDAALRHLACLPQLRELTISGCDVTFAGLSALSDTLESLDLDLGGCDITDASVLAIARSCPRIKWLEIGTALEFRSSGDHPVGHFSDASIVELASRCRDLWWLSLSSTSITDVSLQAIARNCRKLRHLKLECPRMTDAGLIPLAQCWSLRQLELLTPHVTNEGISHVSRLNNFKLSDNDRVTPAAFVGLIRRSPRLTFIHCLSCKHLEKSSIFWHCYLEFENDHLQCQHPAMQSMAWHVPESELRELPPAAIAALGYEFEEA